MSYTEFSTTELARSTQRSSGRAKRGFDLLFAIFLLPVIAPVVLVLYVLTRLDGGPGFYGHKRVGKNGRFFRCWKIRTMVVNGDEVLKRHLAECPAAAAEWARDFKLTDDPRVTRLGAFLRKTSLDELPQLWNVLCNEMSFVGPRPITEPELERYGAYSKCYLALKPGITGIWQVSGRGDVDYDTRVKMDAFYYRRRSFLGDLSIIALTARAVLNRTGQ